MKNVYTIDEVAKYFHLCGCTPMVCLHAIYGNAGGPLDYKAYIEAAQNTDKGEH